LYFFIAYGALIFVPSFLIRCLHLSLATVSVRYGAVAAVGSVIGTLGGGWLADRLGRRDIRWLAWLPAIACTATAPLYIIGFQMNDFNAFLCVGFLAGILLTGGLPPVFAAIHAVCGSRRRATAIAIVLFSAGLVGAGFGPLATGALSDELSSKYGIDGLRYSLTLVMSLLVATGGTFYLFGRTMTADLEA
jgi:MFS family permease